MEFIKSSGRTLDLIYKTYNLKTINSVFESLIFNLLVIIHRLMSDRQLFTFEIASNDCLLLSVFELDGDGYIVEKHEVPCDLR